MIDTIEKRMASDAKAAFPLDTPEPARNPGSTQPGSRRYKETIR